MVDKQRHLCCGFIRGEKSFWASGVVVNLVRLNMLCNMDLAAAKTCHGDHAS